MAERPLSDNQVEELLRQMVGTLFDSSGSTGPGETALRAAEAVLLILADSMDILGRRQAADQPTVGLSARSKQKRKPILTADDIATAVVEYRNAHPPQKNTN